MGFTKGRGRELAIFNLVETILHRQFENRDGPAKHQRTCMLVWHGQDSSRDSQPCMKWGSV